MGSVAQNMACEKNMVTGERKHTERANVSTKRPGILKQGASVLPFTSCHRMLTRLGLV